MSWMRWSIVLGLILFGPLPVGFAQRNLGFDNRKPSAQPYLKPEESVARLRVPPGFEVTLFAAEPDIINPIAVTIDERGRLWVVECYEYPKRTPKGQKPRDRIKILEDTSGTGRADKVTVWAEGKDLPVGFDLASGIEVGHGGVFLGAAPHLFFLRDTKGTGRCDLQEILLSGFGSQDTHETLNTLQWGPDGRLHGLHGIFTHSRVDEVQLNAALWRYHVRDKKFDLFAEGTSNPWGLDFDPHGQAFLTACVIPHAFHMIPGGTYIRQAGSSFNPYAYGLLREISDHVHHAESGWAHAGALVLQGDHIPAAYQGSLLMGSIHGCTIKRDRLERHGSTFVARHAPDFLVSEDKNFRPINLRWGPDGSIYVIDWHDQNPCHQAPPDSWDMTHGRIYKIQPTGTKSTPTGDLARKSSRELVDLLRNNNPWWHRTALRLLSERRDPSVAPALREMALRSPDDQHSLRALWGLYAVGAFDEAVAEQTLGHKSPWMRSWTIRLLGEAGQVSDRILRRLVDIAGMEEAPEVRLQLASTAQRLTRQDTLPLLHRLLQRTEDAGDPCIPLMLWLAYEPRLVAQKPVAFAWLRQHATGNPLVTDALVPRVFRRLVATGMPDDLHACLAFLGEVQDLPVRRRGLEALVQALQNRQIDPPPEWQRLTADLRRQGDAEAQRLARRLAVNFRDAEAVGRALTLARDRRQPTAERIDAIRDLALAHPPEALRPLQELLADENDANIRSEACRALAAYDSVDVARTIVGAWKRYPPAVRVEAVNLLAGRREWARELLAAVGQNVVPRTDLNDNTILRLRALRDPKINQQIEAVWGRVRDTPEDLNALIEQMRAALNDGRASHGRGQKVFETQCAKCHKFEGKGSEVGPNLEGAARDIEYLLVNVLDPNRVVGQPYYTRFVTLKSGRVETGLLVSEDEQSLTLKGENDAVKVLSRKEIEEIVVQPKSVMPEGLSNNMTPQDFRDLIRYVMAHPFLTEVAVAGPLNRTDGIVLEPTHPLEAKGLTWTSPVVGPTGRIPLPLPRQEGPAIAYVAAQVTAPTAVHTRLQVGAAYPVQVWLNGKQVYEGKPDTGPTAPDQVGIDVELRPGVNQLLFRATYQGSREMLYARLLDPQRQLQYPESKK